MKLIVILVLCIASVYSQTYNYGNLGPEAWPFIFPLQCNGDNQSPIDINENYAIPNKALRPIIFNNYDQALTWTPTKDSNGSINFLDL